MGSITPLLGQYHTPTADAATRAHAPLAHIEQGGYARCPVQQANGVWFQPSPQSALTAMNVDGKFGGRLHGLCGEADPDCDNPMQRALMR